MLKNSSLVLSYSVEIKHVDKLFYKTVKIFNDAVSFCVEKFEYYWEEIELLSELERIRFGDSLIHTTNSNMAKYNEFDKQFKGMPAYFRRTVISTAMGYLSSYHSNLTNWENGKMTGNPPRLQTHLNKMPTFYKDNMYRDDCEGDAVRLKLFVNNSWNWVEIKLKHTDVVSIRKHMQEAKMSCPTLERRNKKWFLRFAFDYGRMKLKDTKLEKRHILAVDLGINTDATCSVMNVDGAILARKFIDFPSDKDHLYHTLNKIKKVQQKFGSNNISKLWRHARFHNDELAKKIASAIVDTAVANDCDVIVFEYLDMRDKIRGSKKQRLHMWKKNTIQRIVEYKAHKVGIRVSHVCAWGTSKLAFDGSGNVSRGKEANLGTYSLCRFPNGKVYNCDLSASYNIGARYFIREVQKSLPAMVWSDIVAKVPQCEKRTQCTYNTLLEINRVV